MSKRFGILITVLLAFAVAPAVAFAGDRTDDAAKKAERLLKFAKITAEWTTAPDADEILRRRVRALRLRAASAAQPGTAAATAQPAE